MGYGDERLLWYIEELVRTADLSPGPLMGDGREAAAFKTAGELAVRCWCCLRSVRGVVSVTAGESKLSSQATSAEATRLWIRGVEVTG